MAEDKTEKNEMNRDLARWYDENEGLLRDWAKDIWSHPETAMQEFHACEVTADIFRKNGFSVRTFHCKDPGLPPNTVVASWGSGHPVIGIIGEYDALSGLGQDAVPYFSPKEGPGHGCGHALMSPACGGAALALKTVMEKEGLPGTVRFFGCPAEETVEGKVYMFHGGAFDGIDCCLAWHPQPKKWMIREDTQNCCANLKVEFFGRSAHAASKPHMGRSALDACELTNVAANYLREHVEPTTRIHYSYLAAGEAPNVVPKYAALHYFLRTKDLESNYEILERFKKIVHGAALMTETQYKITLNSMVTGCLQIDDFNDLYYNAQRKIPPLEYAEEDRLFAERLFAEFFGHEPGPGDSVINTELCAPTHQHLNAPQTTDAGLVANTFPTSRSVGLGSVNGVAGHSWAVVACSGTGLGMKAAVYASKGLAQCAYEILRQPEKVEEWKQTLADLKQGKDLATIPPGTVLEEG